jgi:hypothetical protein
VSASEKEERIGGMIWLVAIRDGGSGRVERCEACLCRAYCAVGQEAELRGPRTRFE